MEQNTQLIEEKLKNSFSNIKKDITTLNNDITALKNEINHIKGGLDQIKTILTTKNFLDSTGNKGVINNHQQSTIINTPTNTNKEDQNDLILQEHPKSQDLQEVQITLDKIKKDLQKTFKNLTDREFSIFMTIYELGQQLDRVTYADIAQQLSLTEMTIRSYVASLINKHLPIEKTRRFNNKVSLSIRKEFKDLNLASKLISLRTLDSNQKTLFSDY